VWLLEAATSWFQIPTDESRMQCFRIALGVACFAKFAVALVHGSWHRFAAAAYERYALVRMYGASRAALIAGCYRSVIVLRTLAAAAYGLGLLPRAMGIIVIAGLLFETLYEYRFNCYYLALMVACTVISGNPGYGLCIEHRWSSANTWAQFLVVLITIDLYWNSAWQKTRSRHFISGLILAQYLHFTARIRHQVRYREFFYPELLVAMLGAGDALSIRRWRVLAVAVAVIEVVLPIGLLVPELRPFAIAGGIVMHLAFTLLLPLQLFGFSLGTVASYWLFVSG
jgi:hypothetical protein